MEASKGGRLVQQSSQGSNGRKSAGRQLGLRRSCHPGSDRPSSDLETPDRRALQKKEIEMYRLIAGLVLLCAVFAGCGDSKSTPTAPATAQTPRAAPQPPARPANLELEGSYKCVTRFCDNAIYELSLTNTGGRTANINYLRGENRNDQPIWEFGANVFIEVFGTNQLNPGETLSSTFRRQLGYYLTVGYGAGGQNWEVRYRTNPPR